MKTRQFKAMLKRGAACFLIATCLVGGTYVPVLAEENTANDETSVVEENDETSVVEENDDLKTEDTEESLDITDETSQTQEESSAIFDDENTLEEGYLTPKNSAPTTGNLTLEQNEYYVQWCSETITISATYKGSKAPTNPKLVADSSTRNNVSFSGISVLGPINGEYILSLQATPLEPGKYSFSISVNGTSASGKLIVDYVEFFPVDDAYAIVGEERKLHFRVKPKEAANYTEFYGDDFIEVVDFERGIADDDVYITVRGKKPGEGTIYSDHEGDYSIFVEPKLDTLGLPSNVLYEYTEVPMIEVRLNKPNEEYLNTFLNSLFVTIEDVGVLSFKEPEIVPFVTDEGRTGRLIFYLTPVGEGSATYIIKSPGGQEVKKTYYSGHWGISDEWNFENYSVKPIPLNEADYQSLIFEKDKAQKKKALRG